MKPSQQQLDAGFAFIRAKASSTPLGHMVPDDKLREFTEEFAEVILSAPSDGKPGGA